MLTWHLSRALQGLQRWQKFVILITLVCSQLLVNSACSRASAAAIWPSCIASAHR
jgi:hypothetical protein